MNQTARIEQYPETDPPTVQKPKRASTCDVVGMNAHHSRGESLSEAFCEEIDRWARRALASNGFGDY
jgi:hypothetical protein